MAANEVPREARSDASGAARDQHPALALVPGPFGPRHEHGRLLASAQLRHQSSLAANELLRGRIHQRLAQREHGPLADFPVEIDQPTQALRSLGLDRANQAPKRRRCELRGTLTVARRDGPPRDHQQGRIRELRLRQPSLNGREHRARERERVVAERHEDDRTRDSSVELAAVLGLDSQRSPEPTQSIAECRTSLAQHEDRTGAELHLVHVRVDPLELVDESRADAGPRMVVVEPVTLALEGVRRQPQAMLRPGLEHGSPIDLDATQMQRGQTRQERIELALAPAQTRERGRALRVGREAGRG